VPVTATVASSPQDLERRVDVLESRLDAANALLKDYEGELRWLRMFKVSGYIQGQLLLQFYNASGSPNATGGVLPPNITPNDVTATPATSSVPTTNQDYFRLRRARLKVEFEPIDSARFVFEIDPTPAGGEIGGTGTIAREIEAIGIARYTPHIRTEFGMGIFKIPFGFEVLQNDADRPFIERSWGERNMTPGEFGAGVRAYTTFFDDKLTFQAAVVNGQLEGEKTFSVLPDLGQGKDLVGRLNYDFGPVDAGVSGYYGAGELVDQAMLEFKQYPRGAGNLEVHVHHVFVPQLGETKFFAEGTVATNMDRGINYGPGIGLPAMPAVVTTDIVALHEANVWGRVEQDLTHWFTLGLRFDYYSPNDTVCATLSSCSSIKSGRTTYAAVGAVHFTRWLQYMLEYDHSIDNVHAAGAPGPTKLIDVVSNVLQVRF
jgi:phosphate-selective porin O/P